MADLMSDKHQPPQTDGGVENILTRNDLRKTVVRVSFIPKLSRFPEVRPRRFEFPTSVLAADFIATICPKPGAQLGSPKQFRAKTARILRLGDVSIITNYTIQTEIEASSAPAILEDPEYGSVEVEAEDTFTPGDLTLQEPSDDTDALLDNILDPNP